MRPEVIPDLLLASLAADPAYHLLTGLQNSVPEDVAETIRRLHSLRMDLLDVLGALCTSGSEGLDGT